MTKAKPTGYDRAKLQAPRYQAIGLMEPRPIGVLNILNFLGIPWDLGS